jgi:hypothetical protein
VLEVRNCPYLGGQPCESVITVEGNSAAVCNFFDARVELVFRKCSIPTFLRGNANDDGRVDIADAVWILNDLFGDGPPSPCPDASDANDSGVVDISDPLFLINYLFLANGGPPPAPGADICGPDPTDDALSACVEAPGSCLDAPPTCP